MNLILLRPDEIGEDGRVTVAGPRAHHIVSVLRVEVGQPLRVGVLDGSTGIGLVEAAADGQVTLRCRFDGVAPPRPPVDLLLALPRPKVLARLWAPLAALGVGHIMLTNAERVERPYFDSHVLEPARVEAWIIEGLQQARDTRVPVVSVHRRFKVLVEDELDRLSSASVRLLAHPGAGTSIREAVPKVEDLRVLLAVGPEGGWNDYERQLLVDHGFHPVTMGPRVLRTDTASVALITLVYDALAHAS